MTHAEALSLMTIAVCPITAVAAARADGAGGMALAAIGGFAIGFGFALASLKIANAALFRAIREARNGETIGSVTAGLLYLLVPMGSLIAALATSIALTTEVLRLVA